MRHSLAIFVVIKSTRYDYVICWHRACSIGRAGLFSITWSYHNAFSNSCRSPQRSPGHAMLGRLCARMGRDLNGPPNPRNRNQWRPYRGADYQSYSEVLNMKRRHTLALIDAAFKALPDMQNHFTTWNERLFEMSVAAERDHRRGRTAAECGISVNAAAQLFTVKHLADSILEPQKWSVDDILSIRTECLYAQAIAKQYGAAIKTAWAQAHIEVSDVAAIDYAELMNKAKS